MDGTPVSRGSSATASRNARANALNCASTRWWGSRPARTRTCTRDLGVERERLEDVAGQRARRSRRRSRRTPGRRARRCGRSRAARRRRRRACTSASSSGTVASPKRRMPPCRRAPRAAPAPSTIAVSSTVWWASMWVSPVGRARSRSTSECRANAVEHVVVEPDAGGDVGAARCRRGRPRRGPWTPWSRARSRAVRLIAGCSCRASSITSVEGVPGTLPSPPAVPIETRSQPSGPVSRTARRGRAAPARRRAGRRRCRTARSWRRCRPP